MNRIDDELSQEIADLTDRGFKAAWIRDLVVGDIFAGPRMFSFNEPRELFVVDRILNKDASYYDEDQQWQTNYVVSMIVHDELDLERHLSYGDAHEIYIWKG